ncbi:MAG: AP2 domain-containing protein [Pseudomonadota bacterium]
MIDIEDVALVESMNWQLLLDGRNRYAITAASRINGTRAISMHRLIMDPPDGLCVDHIDGDGLNNVRSNLRLADKFENARNAKKRLDNKSGYKGVSFHKRLGKWRAYIATRGTQVHLGYFDTPELAHQSYCEASQEMHAEFGRTC